MTKHKQQTFWQIYIPMLLVMGFFAYITYSFFGNTLLRDPNLRIWSDISLLIILLPLFFSFVVAFILLFVIIFLLSKYQWKIGAFLSNIADLSTISSHWATKFTNFLTHPLILVESIISQMLPHKKDKDKNG